MVKALKAIPVIGCLISLYFIATSAMLFSSGSIELGQATLMIVTFGVVLYISYGAFQEINTLEKRLARQSKDADVNTQLKYTTDSVDYASSFRLGEPVVTTEEYCDGAGYHAFLEAVDRTDIGRPFKIRMCGNKGFDWVSIDEIVPDREIETEIKIHKEDLVNEI